MRILLDTNVLIASIISHGVCFELFEHCIRNHNVISSKYIINEFVEKLNHKFKYTKSEVNAAKNIIFERADVYFKDTSGVAFKNTSGVKWTKEIEIVQPENIKIKNLKDKNDFPIIGTAIRGKCDCIITGDKHLQELNKIKDIDIIRPSEFWQYEVDYLKSR